jgi:hypothetical protein
MQSRGKMPGNLGCLDESASFDRSRIFGHDDAIFADVKGYIELLAGARSLAVRYLGMKSWLQPDLQLLFFTVWYLAVTKSTKSCYSFTRQPHSLLPYNN